MAVLRCQGKRAGGTAPLGHAAGHAGFTYECAWNGWSVLPFLDTTSLDFGESATAR